MDPRTGNIEQGPSRMGFDSSSSQNVYAKESSPIESSSRKVYTTSRLDNPAKHSFKGRKESNRTKNEPSGSAQHLTYQSHNENFPTNPIMDSGYGSLDKLKTDGNNQMRSPVLSRRLSNKMVKQTAKSVSNSFDSDDGGCDGIGSNGFVNAIGVPMSMKDTAYDFVRMKK